LRIYITVISQTALPLVYFYFFTDNNLFQNGTLNSQLAIPFSYHPDQGGKPGIEADLSRAVYYGYQEIAADLAGGTSIFPTFDYAVKRHEFLDEMIRAADSGCRLTLLNA
jgi:hypothetical protein